MNTQELNAAFVSRARHYGESVAVIGANVFTSVHSASGQTTFGINGRMAGQSVFCDELSRAIQSSPAAALAAYKELQQ